MENNYTYLETKFLNKKLNPAVFAKLPLETKHNLILSKIRNSKNSYKYEYKMETFKGFNEKITIICPTHGEFEQRLSSHIDGIGCSKCGGSNRKTTNEFVHDAKLVHGDTYDYSKVSYINNITKIEIICPIHGSFWQTPLKHLENQGCPKCSNSKGEIKISKCLNELNINHIEEKTFPNLLSINNKLLRLDFYIQDKRIAIEYNGQHHYEEIKGWKNQKDLSIQRANDEIKKVFCEQNGIKLIIIPYWDYDNIENIIKDELE